MPDERIVANSIVQVNKMNIQEKIQLFINLAFNGSRPEFAKAVGRAPSSVHHWLTKGKIESESLSSLRSLGMSMDWLFDENVTDISEMFATNEAGSLLKAKYFGSKIAGAITPETEKERNI